VSLFAFGFLLPRVSPGTILSDATQIAMNVSVPQIRNQRNLSGKVRAHTNVFKDLVIWPKPWMTCWSGDACPTEVPLAILEWKFNCRRPRAAAFDVAWLREFTTEYPACVGYGVCVDRQGFQFAVQCTRIEGGQSAIMPLGHIVAG
jgi:hypothetical protein